MKKKKSFVVIVAGVLVVVAALVATFFLLNDKNKLTVDERSWLDENVNTIQNINIINNANVFGKNSYGVFYDFLNDFSLEYGMKINPITFNLGANPEGITFNLKNQKQDSDILFYTDHYVLISNKNELITDITKLNGKTIGIYQNNNSYVATYLSNVTLKPYETDEAMFTAIGTDIEYAIVPMMQYLDQILTKNYNILYHFSDINVYYVMQTADTTLSTVLTKYFARWQENIKEYFDDHEFELFTESLKISDADVDKLQGVVHNYGFVNMSPYEVIMGGKYGGIVSIYLKNFSDFADIEFNFVKYANLAKFKKAITDKKVEVYFNYYNISNDNPSITGPVISYVVAENKNNSNVINSINSLIGKTVFVENNSKIHNYIKDVNNINIITYENLKDIKKEVKNHKLSEYYLVIDKNIYDFNHESILKDYAVRYENTLNNSYEFKVNNNENLANLFKNYLKTLDYKNIEAIGLENHAETIKAGTFMSRIAKYIIYLFVIIAIIALLLVKKSRKITIARRIKKDDKLKFIDQLTSLKNRNYLSENISVWNNNTIYPQAIIVLDLNRLQEINDVYGYEEGDKQIQAAASALVKTQLDNSEIMRTDGNEFVIYIVGYTEKQVTNYMHKLNKELNKLPYDFGAEFGHSMIMDNIKTIEDAMNEAVEDMKKQKALENEKETKK